MTRCIQEIVELRSVVQNAKAAGQSVGLVPTMGALHEGHLSLVRRARGENDVVIVSVFVNPTQFGPREDFDRYPRDLARDLALCEQAGADAVFAPSAAEMYPPGFCTWVNVEGLTEGLCGRSRPGHFRGVCTVVAKLFNICQPDRAYFGEKDAQQLVVVKRMVQDLNFPIEIVPCSTVREPDGLAMSSRNMLLTREQRQQAPMLYKALKEAERLIKTGVKDTTALKQAIATVLGEASLGQVDYIEIVDAETLAPMETVWGECLIALAVRFGEVRLIDNIRVTA
ncbi:MAG: pantoate--beta-alanine ligase [Thermoleophilia bacterium]|nr:pantoate--beta-alanine ligase [Thermoleophilia bacterium]